MSTAIASKDAKELNEKLLKKEAKKLEKQQKKLAREQQRARDFLTRESKFNEVSTKRGWKDWESWCEEVKLSELKEELEVAVKSADHVLDRSNHAIEVFQTHRSHAEEQYLRNFQNHSGLIDYITSELFFISFLLTLI